MLNLDKYVMTLAVLTKMHHFQNKIWLINLEFNH